VSDLRRGAVLVALLGAGPGLAALRTEGPQAAAAPPAKPAPPAATPVRRAETAFEKAARLAKEAHAAQQLDEALALYEKALKLDPKWAEGRFGLATVLYDLDRFSEARVAFRRVNAEKPENALAWAFRGLCSFRLKEHETALAEIQKGRDIGLGDNLQVQAVANYHAAILLTRFGKFEAAYEALREFALRDQDNPGVIEAFGLAVLRQPYLPDEAPPEKREMVLMAGRAGYEFARGRRSPNTRRIFETLVARYPEEPNIRYAWGAALMMDEPEAAIAEFRRVLAMDPTYVPAMLQIAFQRIKEGAYPEALPYAEKAVETDPRQFAARNALGRTLLELGQTERAIEELETGARLAPDSPQMFFHLARAYQRAGRKEDSERARATFVKIDKLARQRRTSLAGQGGLGEAPPDTPESPPN
jgi:tetratricopeptide (TPR) repeat protein